MIEIGHGNTQNLAFINISKHKGMFLQTSAQQVRLNTYSNACISCAGD